jgi:hypothetical protein
MTPSARCSTSLSAPARPSSSRSMRSSHSARTSPDGRWTSSASTAVPFASSASPSGSLEPTPTLSRLASVARTTPLTSHPAAPAAGLRRPAHRPAARSPPSLRRSRPTAFGPRRRPSETLDPAVRGEAGTSGHRARHWAGSLLTASEPNRDPGDSPPRTRPLTAEVTVSRGMRPPAPAPASSTATVQAISSTVTVQAMRRTTAWSRRSAHPLPSSVTPCHSLRGWVRVLSPHERTRPRARSPDTPVTEDPPTPGDRGPWTAAVCRVRDHV